MVAQHSCFGPGQTFDIHFRDSESKLFLCLVHSYLNSLLSKLKSLGTYFPSFIYNMLKYVTKQKDPCTVDWTQDLGTQA